MQRKCNDAMKTTFILRGNPNQHGQQFVYIRTSDKQKRVHKKTDLLLTPDQFERCSRGKPLKNETGIYKRFLSLMDEKEDQPDSIDFYKYVRENIRAWDKEKKPGTLRQITSEINKLKVFREDVTLAEITPAFLQGYKEHCYRIGNKGNTVWKTFKFLKMMMRKAEKERLIDQNPFDIFEMPKYKDPPRKYLIVEDLKKIEKLLDKDFPEQIKFCATWFLISCYTGLRYGDAHGFIKKRDIVKNRIIIYTSKTGEPVSMPLTDHVQELFNRIDFKAMHYTNEGYNRLLKIVGELAEIKTPLTSHLARHTAAIRWADAGISQEVVGKLLGQKSLKTTAIYYKISGKRIDQELDKLN